MTNSKILNLVLNIHRPKEARTANSRFAKAGVSCFYDAEVPNSSFVHLLKFSAENPAFAKRQKRCRQYSSYTKRPIKTAQKEKK